MEDMKKILIVAPIFGKDLGAGATNNFHLALSLSNSFEIYVLAVNSSGKKNNYFYKNLHVKYSSPGLFHLLHLIIQFFKKNLTHSNSSFKEKNRKERIILTNYHVLFKLKRKLLVPDTFIDWLPVGVMDGFKCIRKEKIDIIISSATPYTSHLVSYILSKLFNIPLVLYYRDPWVIEKSVKRGNLRFKFESYLERKIISAAKLLIFCTESTRQAYCRLFQLSSNKTATVYFGFDQNDFDYSLSPHKGNNINLVYGGRILPGQRNIVPLLRALSKLPPNFPLHIDLFIKEGASYYYELIKKFNVEKFIHLLPPLTHKEFCHRLRKYDYLILLGNVDPLQIPSKLYDYIGSRRPIFLIRNNQRKDETFKIVSAMSNSIISNNDVDDIKEALYNMVEFKKSNRIVQTPLDFVSKFTWSEREKEYLELIKNVINEGNIS